MDSHSERGGQSHGPLFVCCVSVCVCEGALSLLSLHLVLSLYPSDFFLLTSSFCFLFCCCLTPLLLLSFSFLFSSHSPFATNLNLHSHTLITQPRSPSLPHLQHHNETTTTTTTPTNNNQRARDAHPGKRTRSDARLPRETRPSSTQATPPSSLLSQTASLANETTIPQ